MAQRKPALQKLYDEVISRFEQEMPVAETELHFDTPFGLLVAVMLSAQCTDKRVNMVTPALMQRFPTPEAMAEATPEEVLEYIHSVSYPNSKARHLVGMARKLVGDFGGEVPCDMDALTSLPGVGRKTANVMMAVQFDKAAMPVDTHVFRVSHRMGLVAPGCTTPLSVERELVKHIPEALLSKTHHWLILHGRYTCTARAPKCTKCVMADICPRL